MATVFLHQLAPNKDILSLSSTALRSTWQAFEEGRDEYSVTQVTYQGSSDADVAGQLGADVGSRETGASPSRALTLSALRTARLRGPGARTLRLSPPPRCAPRPLELRYAERLTSEDFGPE